MLTKKLSLWISLAMGILLMASMAAFATRPHASGFGGLLSSWLIFAPVVLLVFPLIVPRVNTAYKKAKLSLATSIFEYVFFASCLAFAIALDVSTNLLLNMILLGVMFLGVVAISVKASLSDWADNRTNAIRKVAITLLVFVAILWLPYSVLLNPGWGSLMIYTPYVLIALVPLVVLIANTTTVRRVLPISVFAAELAFLLLWSSLGFLYVNGGDTDESIGSLASRLLGGLWGRDLLIQLSPVLMKLVLFLALALLPYIFFYKQGKSKILFRIVPLVITVVALLLCAWSPISDGIDSHKQAQTLKDAASVVQRNILSSTSGSQVIKYEVKGDGLIARLKCSHRETCPSLSIALVVPIQDNQEWDFAWGVIRQAGYANPSPLFPCFTGSVDNGVSCLEWGAKSGSEMHVEVKQASPSEMPKQSVSPKVWRLVRIDITPYDGPTPYNNGEINRLPDYPTY